MNVIRSPYVARYLRAENNCFTLTKCRLKSFSNVQFLFKQIADYMLSNFSRALDEKTGCINTNGDPSL